MQFFKHIFLPVSIILLSAQAENCFSQQWKLLADTAKMYRDNESFDTALAYYRLAEKSLFADSSLCDNYLKTGTIIGDIYFSVNKFDSALATYLKIKDESEKLHGSNAALASIDDKLGRTYIITSDFTNAKKYFSEAKNIREKIFTKQSLEYALSCTFLANVFTTTGEYDEAVNLYIEGKTIRENLLPKDSAGYAQVCNNLANLYRETGRYGEAEPLALKAKLIRGILSSGSKGPNYISGYAISCTNLANLYRDMGQYNKAEALYLESKAIRAHFQPFNQNPAYASSCNILADLYYFMGRNEEAETLYLEAKTIREKLFGKNNVDYAQSCNNLANLYRDAGKYKEAENFALEAYGILEKVAEPNSPDVANNFENLGIIYNQTNRYKQAENAFLMARNTWKNITDISNPSYSANSFYLGEAYWGLHDYKKADFYFTESFYSRYNQLKKIFQFTSENEKEQYLQTISGSFDEYQSFYFSSPGSTNYASMYALNLSNRNLILSATEQVRQSINNSGDSLVSKKYKEWISVKNQLGALYLKKDTATNTKIAVLEEKGNKLEKELVKTSGLLQNALKDNTGWETIRQYLKPGEAAIEFSSFNFYNGIKQTDSICYVALILRKDIPGPQLAFLFEKKQFDSVFDFTEGINNLYSGEDLFNLVWKPTEKYLKDIHKIYYAPAGDLFKISFAALRVNTNEVLSDKYQLVQLNSTASVIDKNENFISSSGKIQLYGGIEYDTSAVNNSVAINTTTNKSLQSLPGEMTRNGSIRYLPATKTEIESISRQAMNANITATTLSGIYATEESFKALNGNASPTIIHIATHGFFFPDPKENKHDSVQARFDNSGKAFRQSENPLFRSGLLFAGAGRAWKGKNSMGIEDGIVTAYDVSNLYLPNTKLVVLSACETALGDIKGSEGVYGLQRSFEIAGVKNLVMSLWKVPDTETSEFMRLFYNNIFRGQPVDLAFNEAQSTMKNKYRKEPYKWAAWILIK